MREKEKKLIEKKLRMFEFSFCIKMRFGCLSFMLVESSLFRQNLKVRLNYVSRHSVRKEYQKIEKIAEITVTATKIGYFAQFGIFGISATPFE